MGTYLNFQAYVSHIQRKFNDISPESLKNTNHVQEFF